MQVKEMKVKSEFLYIDMESYNGIKDNEAKLMAIVSEMEDTVLKVMGKDFKIDYVQLTGDPTDYLVQSYWQKYCQGKSPSLDRKHILEIENKVTLHPLGKAFAEYTRQYNSLSRSAPKVTAQGLKSVVKKDDYKRYLNKDKSEYFEIVKSLHDTHTKLMAEGFQVNPMKLIQYVSMIGGGLWLGNAGELTINYSIFAL